MSLFSPFRQECHCSERLLRGSEGSGLLLLANSETGLRWPRGHRLRVSLSLRVYPGYMPPYRVYTRVICLPVCTTVVYMPPCVYNGGVYASLLWVSLGYASLLWVSLGYASLCVQGGYVSLCVQGGYASLCVHGGYASLCS